jgi:hypothetical protein
MTNRTKVHLVLPDNSTLCGVVNPKEHTNVPSDTDCFRCAPAYRKNIPAFWAAWNLKKSKDKVDKAKEKLNLGEAMVSLGRTATLAFLSPNQVRKSLGHPELCEICKEPIRMMSAIGSGVCGENHKKEREDRRLAQTNPIFSNEEK